MRQKYNVICIIFMVLSLMGCCINSRKQCETTADEYAHYDYYLKYKSDDLVIRIEETNSIETKFAFDDGNLLYTVLTEISVSELSTLDISPQIYTLDYARIDKSQPYDNYVLISGLTLEIYSNNIIAIKSVVESQLSVGIKRRYYSVNENDYAKICSAILECLKSVE